MPPLAAYPEVTLHAELALSGTQALRPRTRLSLSLAPSLSPFSSPVILETTFQRSPGNLSLGVECAVENEAEAILSLGRAGPRSTPSGYVEDQREDWAVRLFQAQAECLYRMEWRMGSSLIPPHLSLTWSFLCLIPSPTGALRLCYPGALNL